VKPPKKTSTLEEKFAMRELIKQHSAVDPSDGVRYFEDGWDHDRIAKTVNPDFGTNQSKSVADMLGENIYTRHARRTAVRDNIAIAVLSDRVTQLEALVERLYLDLGIPK
jgi:hypothetical protein